MLRGWKFALSAVAAGALVGGAASTALAGKAAPFRPNVSHTAKRTTFGSDVYSKGTVHADKNISANGKAYFHGSAQVWKGLLINSGGITVNKDGINVVSGGLTVGSGGGKFDSVVVSGPLSAHDATVTGNLQSGTLTSQGAINGQSLTLTSGATVGGTLGVTGKITGNGVDAGSGAINGASLTTGAITDTGTLAASDIHGTNLTITGNVNFAQANVTGLNLSNLNLGNLTLSNLTLGNSTLQGAPLTLTANNKSAQLGVNTAGALTVDNLAVGAGGATVAGPFSTTGNATIGGTLNVTGTTTFSGGLALTGGLTLPSAGLTTPTITAPTSGTPATLGALTLTGNGIVLAGPTTANNGLTLANAGNLTLSTTSGAASHILASSDLDVAGVLSLSVSGTVPTSGYTFNQVNFQTPYTAPPAITVTAQGNPNPEATAGVAPNVWVELVTSTSGGNTTYTGFKIHYVPSVATYTTAHTITYAYHVIGT